MLRAKNASGRPDRYMDLGKGHFGFGRLLFTVVNSVVDGKRNECLDLTGQVIA